MVLKYVKATNDYSSLVRVIRTFYSFLSLVIPRIIVFVASNHHASSVNAVAPLESLLVLSSKLEGAS